MEFSQLILAIDTSSGCSLGLLTPLGKTFWISREVRKSAHEILPEIEKMLQAEKITIEQLSAITVATGPGSFTGLRIGISVAQAFGFAHDIPIVTISNLALLAYGASMRNKKAKFDEAFFVAEGARDKEIYFGHYRSCPEVGIIAVTPEMVVSLDDVVYPKIASKPCFVGDPWFDGYGQQTDLLSAEKVRPEIEPKSIKQLLDLGRIQFLAGIFVSAKELRPNYVKEHLDYV